MLPLDKQLPETDGGSTDDPDLSVVIVNYNGRPFLKECLDSLHDAFNGYSWEVIVVDNASADGSREYLRSRRDIRLIESEANTGFTGGNNIGVGSARGKFALLLNSDTVCLTPLDPLLACLDDDRVGVAGCALSYADDRVQLSVGYDHTPLRVVLSWLGLGSLGFRLRAFCRLEMDPGYYRYQHRSIDWVSGACLLTRTELWRRIGGLDEMFFMYCEDVDYCRRVRAEGYEVMYTPAARIRHYEAAGKAWVGGVALKRTARSYLLFMRKHFGRASQLFVAAALGLVFMLRSVLYRIGALVRGTDAVRDEKCLAYRNAGIYLFRHGLGTRVIEARI
jgi:GT2 family glycosyltransferase